MYKPLWDRTIQIALEEDLGQGDVTTLSIVDSEQKGEAILYALSDGIVAGMEIVQAVFRTIDPELEFTVLKSDGDAIQKGEQLAILKGRMRSLLTGERVALNFLQRLSGIATKTRKMVDSIQDTGAILLDTRKTTPGLRSMEKYAVKVGGANNHRFNLSDGILIKDNHIQAAGGISPAIHKVKKNAPHTLKIEIEVENIDQLQEALLAGADIILLDNMDIHTMQIAVNLVNGRVLLEASGGITEANLLEVARTGVDFISIGALTHSVSSLDISMEIKS